MPGFIGNNSSNNEEHKPNYISPLDAGEKVTADREWATYNFDPSVFDPEQINRLTDQWEEAKEVPGIADEETLYRKSMLFGHHLVSQHHLSDYTAESTDLYPFSQLLHEIDSHVSVVPTLTPVDTPEHAREILDKLVADSAFGNARRLQAAMTRLFEGLCDAYQGPGTVVHKTEELALDPISMMNTLIGQHSYRAIPAMHDPNQSQFGEDTRIRQLLDGTCVEDISGGFRAYPGKIGLEELAYKLHLRDETSDREASYVNVVLRLPDDYRIEIGYKCDAQGDPLPHDSEIPYFQYLHRNASCAAEPQLIRYTHVFLDQWGLRE